MSENFIVDFLYHLLKMLPKCALDRCQDLRSDNLLKGRRFTGYCQSSLSMSLPISLSHTHLLTLCLCLSLPLSLPPSLSTGQFRRHSPRDRLRFADAVLRVNLGSTHTAHPSKKRISDFGLLVQKTRNDNFFGEIELGQGG
jgi:hypothetical protein